MQALEQSRKELGQSKRDMEATKEQLQMELTSSRAAAQRSEARKKEMELELEVPCSTVVNRVAYHESCQSSLVSQSDSIALHNTVK